MKKLLIIIICILIAASFAACSEPQNPPRDTAPKADSADAQTDAEDDTAPEAAAPDTDETIQSDNNEPGVSEATASVQNGAEDENAGGGSNILTAYFSATGATQGVAETIAEITGADIYEIVPEQPYTEEDLNYNSDSSRTTEEMNDASARPTIEGEVENWDKYEIVYLGYPIWWGEAPRIMDTFVESYDFGGKTVIPFCTSGSSGIGSSAQNLEALSDGGEWLAGRRFGGGASRGEIAEWLEETVWGQTA